MIKEICLKNDFISIHAITPGGGAGKSKHNNEKIDIYDRFNFNVKERKGIASSIIKQQFGYQQKFGPQGLLIYEGMINNVNCSDAGSEFNDEKGIWESPFGINNPTIEQVESEVNKANDGYVEINIYNYKICGIFIDLSELSWFIQCCRSPNEFYSNTISLGLPYYGLTTNGIIEIDPQYIKDEDIRRMQGGSIKCTREIYSDSVKTI